MEHVETNDPRQQPLVDRANVIMEKVFNYIYVRRMHQLNADFSNAAVLMGQEERYAILSCAEALPLMGSMHRHDESPTIAGISIIWTADRNRLTIVEDANNPVIPLSSLSEGFKLKDPSLLTEKNNDY
jgi:hypothetical protein